MSNFPVKADDLVRRLRRMRIVVIHPDDDERATFVAHLKRIGCQVDMIWPTPDALPDYVDVVLFLLGPNRDSKTTSWMSSAQDIARIAIISFETPEILNALERLHVHGVLSKPIRIFGVLAALTTAIGLARHEATLKTRIRSLDETLKARRKIEQAVAILSETRGIDEQAAYKRLRDKSQNSQRSIGDIADAIIAASDV